MEYGIYLDGEIMTTNVDYFKACEEAQQLTKDTGVVHWVMPIENKKIDKTKVIELLSTVIVDTYNNGNFEWMYKPIDTSLDKLCEELNISVEEVQDRVIETF
ncbi:hypothetical protein QMA02_27150 [Bacillus wiedmannii]|uniref:hypothetical protein n=1 Tax=Bacillus wiedmannii TaxID=1890302 RepID=UPI0024AE5D83|nr:hypothetical protein [Bacillus wiedmannii]MDI6679474.1 hypothetical protein [Bacillus wiedmannii]